MQSTWITGSSVLDAFVAGMLDRAQTTREACRAEFDDKWVAREGYGTRLHYANAEAQRMGFTLATESLGLIGMRRAREVVQSTVCDVEESDLTARERARRGVLIEAGGLLYTGSFLPVRFARMSVSKGMYTGSEIRLERELLSASFGEALSTYLHELCHEAGKDGSALFSDALTKALGRAVDSAQELEQLRARWRAAK